MSTGTIAVLILGVTNLATTIAYSRLHMRVADRLRLVSPPKQQQDSAAEQAAPVDIRRTA